ncbi:PE-PGRS family protein [Streptomyces sp. NPDC002889]|uniref:PE-PGRS family protein n=1 Tax=Streptomyces sp. NPDC002889 TaxID=3364669 RepID=UPI003673D9A9
MADFRRQPEWQQQADRHSQLIDPVLTVRPISRFDYTARRPVMAIDHALVFAMAKGSYDVFIPPHRPTRADAATRRYTSVYEVDMGSHPVQLELELPSDDDAFAFGAVADLTWRVSDPVAYVAGGERDVPTRLARELHHLARPVSRRFSIENSPAAEAAVQQAVETGGFAAGIGLAVSCLVRMRLDEEAIAHRKRQRSLRYKNEMLDPEHQYRLRQAQQVHELEVLRQQQAQELTARKIEFYQYHLQHGGVAAWALHLAQHPEDTDLVMNSIRRDQLALIQSQLELIGGDGLEDYQKAESAKHALRAVNDLIRQQGPASPAPPPQGNGHQGALPAGAEPQQPTWQPDPGNAGPAPYASGAPAPAARGSASPHAASATPYPPPPSHTPPAPGGYSPAWTDIPAPPEVAAPPQDPSGPRAS